MKKKKIIKWTQVVRRAVQALSFVLMPGLFISTFFSIKAIYSALAGGTFNFSALLPQILIVAAVIPATMLFGRVFCGFICSFGALGDAVWFISKSIRKRPLRINEKADRVLKAFKYVFLAFILVFIWTLGTVSIDGSLNPWNVFGTYATLSGWSSADTLFSVGGALLLLIIIGSFFVQRFFCRYACPLGAIFSVLSRLRLLKIKKPANGCGACHVCTFNCPMGIPMYKHDRISSGECISCFACTSACPRSNARATVAGKDAAPLAAGLVATAAIMGLYYVGSIASNHTQHAELAPVADVTVTESGIASGSYIDGTYTGSAQGYRGATNVQVTVDNGYIANIAVLSTGDDSEFFRLAKNTVINSIIKTQSAQVDTVTGATYSSIGLMDAVADALNIIIDTTVPETTAPPQASISPAASSAPSSEPSAAGAYADGVYTGTGTGFRGTTEVSVTVSGGNITDIEIVSYADDRRYFERASSSVISSILSSQSVEVDAVSGATFSSNGIMEAVADALGLRFTNPNNTIQGGHGGFEHGGFGRV